MNRIGKPSRGFSRMPRLPFEGLGIVLALVLAVIATIVVLVAPEHHWGPQMWPFYLGAAAILVWVAIDLWSKLRDDRPAKADNTSAADAVDKRVSEG
jgi:threonine/homoserine/homoserine lactone efflux protein